MTEKHQRKRQILDVPGDLAIAVHGVERDGIAGGDDDFDAFGQRGHAADQTAQKAVRRLRLTGHDQQAAGSASVPTQSSSISPATLAS